MIQNYNKKLAQLALVQENKKGYPQGIPKVAEEYYAKTKAYVESQQPSKLPNNNRMQYGGEGFNQDMEEDEQMQAMYGMGFKYGGGLKKFVYGSEFDGVPYSYNKPELTQNDLLGIQPIFIPNENNDELPTPPSNLINNKQQPFEYDYSRVVENNEPKFEGWGDSEAGKKYSAITNAYNKKPEDEDELAKYKQNIGYGLSNEDKAAISLAQRSLPFPGIRPSKSTIKLQRPETRYVDPARALAANAEQYNAARQASAMFAGPQSRYSLNAGQYGKNAADIIGQYANQNVQAGNIAANQAADINNKQMMFDAEQTKNYNDAYREYAKKLWNDNIAYDRGVTAAKIQGSQNARDRYNMNISESPYFISDDATGRIVFNSPKDMKAFYDQKAGSNKIMSASEYSAWAVSQGYKEPTLKDYNDYVERMQGSSKNTSKLTT
jgi:hypothetical protein